jgi:hypothetical protein
MIGGLKTYLPRLAEIVGSTPAALYERQRALTRLGLLIPQAGRGPGSGIKLSADSVAAMVISLMATENLSDVDERMVRLCNARPLTTAEEVERLSHPDDEVEGDLADLIAKSADALTGVKTFRQAIKTLLADPSLSREWQISLSLEQYRRARIAFNKEGEMQFTSFEVSAEKSRVALITRQTRVEPDLVRLIADDLSALLTPNSETEARGARS